MDLIEPKPVPALQRHLQLETDLFCFECNYNLHGQVVTRDERLDILVCRCPECGRWHPAAMAVTATRPWLARVGVVVIAWWVITVLAITGLAGFFMGMGPYAHLETYTEYGGNSGARNYSVRIMRTPPGQAANHYSDYYRSWYYTAWKVFTAITAGSALVAGIFLSVVLWHTERRTQYMAALFPLIVAAFVWWIWWGSYDIDAVVGWSLQSVAQYTLLAIVVMAVGIRIGRPVARWVVRMVIPPRLRQHVHFLWRCDGLVPPGTRTNFEAGVPA